MLHKLGGAPECHAPELAQELRAAKAEVGACTRTLLTHAHVHPLPCAWAVLVARDLCESSGGVLFAHGRLYSLCTMMPLVLFGPLHSIVCPGIKLIVVAVAVAVAPIVDDADDVDDVAVAAVAVVCSLLCAEACCAAVFCPAVLL